MIPTRYLVAANDLYFYKFSNELNSLNANPTKWSNTLKQLVGNLPTNCLSVFDHLVRLAIKGLMKDSQTDSSNTILKDKRNHNHDVSFSQTLLNFYVLTKFVHYLPFFSLFPILIGGGRGRIMSLLRKVEKASLSK